MGENWEGERETETDRQTETHSVKVKLNQRRTVTYNGGVKRNSTKLSMQRSCRAIIVMAAREKESDRGFHLT